MEGGGGKQIGQERPGKAFGGKSAEKQIWESRGCGGGWGKRGKRWGGKGGRSDGICSQTVFCDVTLTVMTPVVVHSDTVHGECQIGQPRPFCRQ